MGGDRDYEAIGSLKNLRSELLCQPRKTRCRTPPPTAKHLKTLTRSPPQGDAARSLPSEIAKERRQQRHKDRESTRGGAC
ncbi:hypothetical protein TIFTF001_027463 [Ficus carica]|uniref:Uncharacterized protein n=1 Tax=Ficus carica TaxID=3494 RepID=A0AA88IYK2_FICCA|nr:hypothetical protein TIFTF001_027463 [Ficus carica]